jgi:hypothetical protein
MFRAVRKILVSGSQEVKLRAAFPGVRRGRGPILDELLELGESRTGHVQDARLLAHRRRGLGLALGVPAQGVDVIDVVVLENPEMDPVMLDQELALPAEPVGLSLGLAAVDLDQTLNAHDLPVAPTSSLGRPESQESGPSSCVLIVSSFKFAAEKKDEKKSK